MSITPRLFAGDRLSDRLKELRQKVQQHLMDWNPDDLLATPEADVTERLLSIGSLECPTLRRAEAYLLDPTEFTVQIGGMLSGRRVTRFTLVVPFDGDLEVFEMAANTWRLNPPRGEVDKTELRVFCYPGDKDANEVKADLDAQLDQIEEYLSWSRHDIDEHQQFMDVQIPRLVANRRAKLLADRELQGSIGFPIIRRPDAAAYSVPLRRRQVATRRRPAQPARTQRFEPEPALTEEDYEAALAVLRNMRNALERSPSTTRHLGEQQIRDLLLVNLNAQFEGRAAGEVFNGEGKTDILIRVDDRNVFIGECKIWRGPQSVTEALDQLLRYLVWRDTKAALLLFIRDAGVSAVTAKAVATIEQHPNYKRRGKTSTEERYDFVLHARGDRGREIHLALLPFLIAGKD